MAPWAGIWSAVPHSVGAIRAAVVGYADGVGVSRTTRDAVAIAVSEAATNAVVHAYVDARAPGRIAVTAELVDDRLLRIVIRDDGRGMQPRADSPGLGLGLSLIVQLTENMRIDSPDHSGTTVSMDFGLLG
jgi:serine/threonine-protein kinase RsbW/stage II sporulation protein AB (anti-sigma F factor)